MMARPRTVTGVLALAIWAYAVWLLLSWTATAEQLIFGAVVSIAIGAAMVALGPVPTPWRVFGRRRLRELTVLAGDSAVRIVRANLSLAVRIWSPRRPLRSGMIIVPTGTRTDGELAAVGLITSLIVDNQLVDLDRSAHELQYHAVAVPQDGAAERAEAINAPTERRVIRISRGR
jgi:multicomponent Na+:H+ antiporter subunit E